MRREPHHHSPRRGRSTRVVHARLKHDLADALATQAQAAGRSVNAELTAAVTAWLAERAPRSTG